MKVFRIGNPALWNTLLLISLFIAIFILPVLPVNMHKALFRAAYSFIYLSAIFSLEKRGKYLLILFVSTIAIEWLSGVLDLYFVAIAAKVVNIVFFLVITGLLINQIATAKKVSTGIILQSVAGYLLLGLAFSIFVLFIMQNDPAAFTVAPGSSAENGKSMEQGIPLYFSFVSLATLGYGDILPLKAYTRSLAIFIAVSGQFYIAVIVALLVGKFSAQQGLFSDD
jgi:hypothetical protein